MILTTTRANVAALVATPNAPAFGYLPGRLIPPAYVVLPGSPYLEPGDRFGEFLIRLTVSYIAAVAVNELSTADLDAEIEDAIVALLNAGWSLESCSPPYPFQANGTQYLAADLNISNHITI